MRGLDYHRVLQPVLHTTHISRTREHCKPGRWQPCTLPHLLGTQLVHTQCRTQHTTTGIRQSSTFKQSLDNTVLTTPAMQGNKSPAETTLRQGIV